MRVANWGASAPPVVTPPVVTPPASVGPVTRAAAAPATASLAADAPAARPRLIATSQLALEGSARQPGAWQLWAAQHALPALMGLVSIGALVLAWHLATLYKLDFYIRFNNIPAPAEVFERLLAVNESPQFLTNIGMSLQRILLGFAVAAVLGVGLGLLIGRYRAARLLMMPALEVLRPIPAIAWVPMSIMLWPSNEVSIVFITFIGAFFPILLSTIHGVEAIDPVLLRAARCLGCPERRLLWQVMLPAALPHVFTGLAVGMGVAWVSLIAAEMISGQFGIGYFTWEAYSLITYAEIALGMITIGVLGLLCSGVIRLTANIVMPWRAVQHKRGAA